jgi:metal-responsive CopG/Arc/MetJ family transcriptional regulator
MSNEQQLVHTGIVFPSEIIKKLDERKGRYISRNKYMLKIIEEYLNENEIKGKLQGAENVVGTTTHQAAAPLNTT